MRYSSWGGRSAEPDLVLKPLSREQARMPAGHCLPYGNGRSYDTSCLPARGTLIDTRSMNALISFDPQSGVLKAEAGMLLADVLSIVIPHGWFLAVTPGTRHVTLGGAIANDVHGKNHHRRGSFGAHVRAFELVRSDGSRQLCSREEKSSLFRATIGGMGLTGLLTFVEIQLMRTRSSWLEQETAEFNSLREYATLDQAADANFEYTVAWIDGHARGTSLGRGLFMRANHVPHEVAPSSDNGARLSVPFTPPFNLVRDIAIGPFNKLYRRRARSSQAQVTAYQPFFYPLDALASWNRLYGPRGFRQFQCAIPETTSIPVIERLIETTHRHGHPSSLVVLKRFGTFPSEGLLSFARPGQTIAMDFADRGKTTADLFADMQAQVMQAGGALNPYKDASMSAADFRKSFPHWQEFTTFIDPAAASIFSDRVKLTSEGPCISVPNSASKAGAVA